MLVQVTQEKGFDFGIKRTCRSCGMNFYDFDKHPSECPNCGAIYELHVNIRKRTQLDDTPEIEFDEEVPFDVDVDVDAVIPDAVEEDIIEDDPFDILDTFEEDI